MQTTDATPNTGTDNVIDSNGINTPGRSVPTKAQSEAHYNELKGQYPKLASGSTFYPTKGGSGKTA